MRPPRDLSGMRFGRLIAFSFSHNDHGRFWLCLCDCGQLCVVRIGKLTTGHTKSCGCLQREIIAQISRTHGGSATRLYGIWKGMIDRCEREASKGYRWYGARGIRVCEKWRDNFPVFRNWSMSHGYQDDLCIDRIENGGNYEPSNCRWITKAKNLEYEHRSRQERAGRPA